MPRKRQRKVAPPKGFLHSLDVAFCTQGFPAERIAELCGVDVATAYRWKSGKSKIPKAAAALLLGELGAFSKHWRGWHIQGEEIISPDGWRISRNDALAVPLMHGQIAALRARIKELEALTDEQPIPGSYPDQIKA